MKNRNSGKYRFYLFIVSRRPLNCSVYFLASQSLIFVLHHRNDSTRSRCCNPSGDRLNITWIRSANNIIRRIDRKYRRWNSSKNIRLIRSPDPIFFDWSEVTRAPSINTVQNLLSMTNIQRFLWIFSCGCPRMILEVRGRKVRARSTLSRSHRNGQSYFLDDYGFRRVKWF